ncbi:cytochrome-c peroxidase [Thermodesulfobacteriota bacterium]
MKKNLNGKCNAISIAFFFLFSLAEMTHLVITSEAIDLSHLLGNKDLQELGTLLFFDEGLSSPTGQSCATCHAPEVGWTGPDRKINKTDSIYPGAVHERFGNRTPPSAAYATSSPPLHIEIEDGEVLFVGGNFWDGRASGWKLGNAAADQAQGPFLNPVEQNLADARGVVKIVCKSEYQSKYKKVASDIWGIEDVCSCDDPDMAYGIIGLAIAAFEDSKTVNAFTSKYDYYLKGKVPLTAQEKRGLELFDGKGKCADCHPSKLGENGEPPLFTDFTYDNLGIPKNTDNPWYQMPAQFNPDGSDWVDPGLGGYLKTVPQYAMLADDHYGKHKVPTLRNIDMRPSEDFVKAFGHNGYFKSIEEILHFYNTRDVPGAGWKGKPWPAPEVSKNLNKEELGNLGLTEDEEKDIVRFLKMLSDGYDF